MSATVEWKEGCASSVVMGAAVRVVVASSRVAVVHVAGMAPHDGWARRGSWRRWSTSVGMVVVVLVAGMAPPDGWAPRGSWRR